MTIAAARPRLGTTVHRLGQAVFAPAGNVAATASGMLALACSRLDGPRRVAEPPAEHLRGSGPVVLVGGFCAPPALLDPMRWSLERLGYAVTTHTVGAGMGCAARCVEALAGTVRDAADRSGAPVSLVAHSRGGQFARLVAQDPDAPVRGLITLGTPLDLYGVSVPLMVQATAVATVGSLGVPGLATLGCLYGSCCAEFRRRLRAPLDRPSTAVFSRQDRAVRWRACQDPAARCVEVRGTHLGLLVDRDTHRVVAEELAAMVGVAPAA